VIMEDGRPDRPVAGLLSIGVDAAVVRASTDLASWKTLDTQEVFDRSPWMKVYMEKVELPGGEIVDDYYQIYMPPSVLIVARTEDDRIVVERAYRHGLRRVSLLLPAGGISPGEDPLEAARRELLEETGYVAPEWRKLGTFAAHTNQGGGRIEMFVASGARKEADPDRGDLEEIEVILLTQDELIDALKRGEVASLGAIAALGFIAVGIAG
jgi:ADP-ribose pyrophosphatase